MASTEEAIVRRVRAALERDPRIELHRHPISVGVEAGAIALAGEAASVAAKKLALRIAASVESARGVVDRLHVAPAERRGDPAIRDALGNFLLGTPELRNCAIRVGAQDRFELLREGSADAAGAIEAAVSEGVVTFEGQVASLSHKRLAGVLAWWTAGCRDVVNSLAVMPDEEDNDGEVVDALALVFELDPSLDAEGIAIRCENWVVTLSGTVTSEHDRRRAEADAWALFGVDEVVDALRVRMPG
ncbi:BON domain-containing protein [Burkholderiaceae bacterium FT117]|uniref:BON domain-containing protein n=1 Tax=Zeimonas sediminis TaxID=2944268 RepID=UPI0023430CA8|nr:BON domain-containing protein [Zeimonas sediminis]MCM5569566.1 BON domain-containing protein [Zeimonas sediminis]